MKKVTIPTNIGIDWSKPQWVQYKQDQRLLVLTTGEHNSSEFTGTAMPCEIYKNGSYSKTWSRDLLNPSPLTFLSQFQTQTNENPRLTTTI